MSLRRFLDCAYALLVEAYVGVGADLVSAIEKVNESIGLAAAQPQPATASTPTAADNDRALAQLRQMMAGL